MAITRLLFRLQVIPIQELQTGASAFQLSFAVWKIEAAKSSRASLSEFRSEITGSTKRRNTSRAAIEDWDFMGISSV